MLCNHGEHVATGGNLLFSGFHGNSDKINSLKSEPLLFKISANIKLFTRYIFLNVSIVSGFHGKGTEMGEKLFFS